MDEKDKQNERQIIRKEIAILRSSSNNNKQIEMQNSVNQKKSTIESIINHLD